MRQPTAVRETRHIGLMGEDIAPFLNTLRALDEPQFKALEKALHLLIPEITGIDVGVNKRGEIEVSLMQGGTPLPASVLSEGTWRMLELLALGGAKETPALLGFEEPETGINPQRLDLIASLLTNLTYTDSSYKSRESSIGEIHGATSGLHASRGAAVREVIRPWSVVPAPGSLARH